MKNVRISTKYLNFQKLSKPQSYSQLGIKQTVCIQQRHMARPHTWNLFQHNLYLKYSLYYSQVVDSSGWLQEYLLAWGSTRRLGKGGRDYKGKDARLLRVQIQTLGKNPILSAVIAEESSHKFPRRLIPGTLYYVNYKHKKYQLTQISNVFR